MFRCRAAAGAFFLIYHPERCPDPGVFRGGAVFIGLQTVFKMIGDAGVKIAIISPENIHVPVHPTNRSGFKFPKTWLFYKAINPFSDTTLNLFISLYRLVQVRNMHDMLSFRSGSFFEGNTL